MPTIDSVPGDALNEIMLRVATPADLIHAACVSKRWRGIIAAQQFLDEYRKRHASSPFVGLYIPQEFGGLPSFRMADSSRPAVDGSGGELDIFRAGEKASSLRGLGKHPEWRLLDCHNSRLLLARGVEAVVVYNPLSHESISVCLPQDDFLPDNFSACLLEGHGDDTASFRVISVQHYRQARTRMVQAIEYDSRTKLWTEHPWERLKSIEVSENFEVMHAGELIFCKYMSNCSSLLMLNTRVMVFSPLPLPRDNNPKHCTIGEMEDGVCCLVSVDCVGLWNISKLRAWKLENMEWKLEKEIELKQVLGNHARYSYYSIRAVTNGIGLLCSSKRQHFVIDLKTFSVKDEFQFEGKTAYPLQMPWPPTFSVAAGSGEQSTPSMVDDLSASLAAETAHDGGQNHARAAKNRVSSKDKNLGSSQVNNVSFTSISDFQDCMQFQQMDLRNQGDTRVAKEANTLLIPEQELVGHAPYGTIGGGVQERDTLTHTDVKRIKEVDYDDQYVDCKLNTEDPLIPCNIDAILLGCSLVNQTLLCGSNDNDLASAQKEECFDKENNVPNSYDLETLVPDHDLIPCAQNLEATRFHHLKKRKSSTRLGNGSQRAFAVSNGLPPKYRKRNLVYSEEVAHLGPYSSFQKKQRCTLYCEDREKAGKNMCVNLEKENT